MDKHTELGNRLWAESNGNYPLYVKRLWKAYNRYERVRLVIGLILLPITLPTVIVMLLIQRRIEA